MIAIGTRACPHFRNDDKSYPIFSQFILVLERVLTLEMTTRVIPFLANLESY